jgi:hypothetical protein
MMDDGCWMAMDGLNVKEEAERGQQAGVRCSGSSKSNGRSYQRATCRASFVGRSDHKNDDNI